MARTKKGSIPSYRRHASGQAIVTLPDGQGGRKDYYLGPFGSEESKQAYGRLIAEWQTNRATLPNDRPGDLKLSEPMIRYLLYADQYYRRPDGTQTQEVADYKLSLRPLKELYAATPAKDFGPLALKTVRQKMADAGLARGVINQRVGRIKRMFKWAVENDLIPASTLQALLAVRGLGRGRSKAKETDRVLPVALETVEATLPHLTRHVVARVRVQLLTGAGKQRGRE